MADVRRRAIVHGRVQGVGFRDFVATRGRHLGLRGTVTNRADGAVECVIEGPDRAVQELVAALHQGPMMARVSAVDLTEEAVLGDLAGFHIG